MKRKPQLKLLGRYIVADPAICHGKPTFRGTRIFVSDVLEMVAEGLAWETIIEQWHNRASCESVIHAFFCHSCESRNPVKSRASGLRPPPE